MHFFLWHFVANDILGRLKLCIIVFYFSFLTKWIKWFYLLGFWFLSLYNLAWQWHGMYYLTGHEVTWHGMAWLDMTWHVMTRHDMSWHDIKWHAMGILGIQYIQYLKAVMAWHDMAWDFLTGQKVIWHGMAWHDMTCYDGTWHDMT